MNRMPKKFANVLVSRVYLRDSLLIDMTADEKTRRGADSTGTDQIGKVFVVVGQDVRRCLVCEGTFTRRTAFDHATVPCVPGTKKQPLETGSS